MVNDRLKLLLLIVADIVFIILPLTLFVAGTDIAGVPRSLYALILLVFGVPVFLLTLLYYVVKRKK